MGLGTLIIVILGIALYIYGLILLFTHVKKSSNGIIPFLPFMSLALTIMGICGFIIYYLFIFLVFLNKIQIF